MCIRDRYPATGKVYAVGPGTDTDKVDTTKESGNTSEAEATPTPAPTAQPTSQPTPKPATPAPSCLLYTSRCV